MFKKAFNICCSLALCLVSVFGLFGLASQPAFAAEPDKASIEITPARQELNLIPGKTLLGHFVVRNRGQAEFTFHLSTGSYWVSNETYDPDYEAKNDYTELQNWIRFQKDEYQLAAGEEIEVPYLIEIPSDLPTASQYATILVETSDEASDAMIQTINRVALVLLGSVEGESHTAGSLVSHSLPSILIGDTPFMVSMRVQNDGNTHFRATETLRVNDFFTGRELLGPDSTNDEGQPIGKVTSTIFPATTRNTEITWDDAPRIGIFRVTQTAEFLDQKETFETVVVICPIWLIVVTATIIALLLFWIIFSIVRRIRRHRAL